MLLSYRNACNYHCLLSLGELFREGSVRSKAASWPVVTLGGLGVGHGSCDFSRMELCLSRCRAGRQLVTNKVCVPVTFEKNSLHHFYTRSFFLSMSTPCLLAKQYVLAETGSVAQVRNEGIDP